MGNRRERKTLTGIIIVLSAVLCFLMGMVMFLEYKELGDGGTMLQENPPGSPPENDPADVPPAGEGVVLDAPEDTEETLEREESSDADTDAESPSGNNEPKDYENQDSWSTVPVQTQINPAQTESTQPIQGEVEVNSGPPEIGSVETVPTETTNRKNETGEF